MSSSSPEPPSSPRESVGSDIPVGGDGKDKVEAEDLLQDVELKYKDEFANEVLVFTSLDDFHEGIKMNRVEGEGSADLFQGVVSFPPGRWLYRYLVDGEWMCDEMREVTYLQGNAFNEIEVDQPSALVMSKSAMKRKEKKKRWRQKKKAARARRRALETIPGTLGDVKDPKQQNKALAEELKKVEASQAAKLSQLREQTAKEKEDLKVSLRKERETWILKIKSAQDEGAETIKELQALKSEYNTLQETQKAAQLEAQQNLRRVQDLEKQQAAWSAEKLELEKKERASEEENKTIKRKMKTLKGELQAKFEKQIEEVTAAMEAELRNTSVNIYYLKKEIEKHKAAEEQAEEQTKIVTASLETLKKDRDALAIEHANAKSEIADLTSKLSAVRVEAGGSSKELTEAREQLEKIKEKYKSESVLFHQKSEEFQRSHAALSAEKTTLQEAETKAKEEMKKLREQNYKLQTELTASQARWEGEVQDIKSKLTAELESSKAEKSTVATKLESHLQEKDSQLQSVQSRLEEFKKDRDDLISAHEKEVTELNDKSKALSVEKEKVEKDLSTVRAEAKALSESKAELEEKLNAQITDLKAKVAALSEEKAGLEVAIKKAASDHLALQQQKESAESTWKAKDEKLGSEIASLTKKLEEEVKTTASLTSELDQEKKAKEKTTAQATAFEQLVKDLEKEKSSMAEDHKQAITEIETQLTDARARISKHEADFETTKNLLEKARDELKTREESLQKEIKEIRKDLDASTTKHSIIKKKLKTIATEAREVGSTVQGLKMAQVQAASGTSKALSLFEKTITRSIEQYSKLLEETLQKYKKEMTERRKYFNLVQELRGNIRVSIRARPMIEHDTKRTDYDEKNPPQMALKFPDNNQLTILRQGVNKEYEFDRVFATTASQVEVFKDTSQLIRSVMDGYNVCIIAYGQTGSGKTFTMEGSDEDRGVNFRALKELFSIKKKRSDDYVYEISVSMLEIYNETLSDLLSDKAADPAAQSKVNIRHGKDGIYVENLTEVEVETEEDIIKYMKLGHQHRAIGKTNMNEHSSRSHSILTVNAQGHNFTAGITYYGKLHLIDLAGSERVSKSGATGERLKEAQAINKSLSALGNVLHSLQLKSKHVPYRDSKLTYLLQDSLGGNSKCMMFVNLSPSSADVEETFCSLEFASRVARIELGQATQNKTRGGNVRSPGGGAGGGAGTEGEPGTPTEAKSPTPGAPKTVGKTGAPKATTTAPKTGPGAPAPGAIKDKKAAPAAAGAAAKPAAPKPAAGTAPAGTAPAKAPAAGAAALSPPPTKKAVAPGTPGAPAAGQAAKPKVAGTPTTPGPPKA